MKRRLQKLKEMGCNSIRFAHNPMAPELLDLCDQMGFLVVDEAFDKWKSLFYEHLYDEWWEKDLEAMLLRDRNHPSVFMWSVGNEVENQEATIHAKNVGADSWVSAMKKTQPDRLHMRLSRIIHRSACVRVRLRPKWSILSSWHNEWMFWG